MSSPLVSIVTPAHNASRFVATTIDSVLSQSVDNWELVIVDDASNDATYSIVERYSKTDSRIKLHRIRENSGAAVARNVALSMAQGRYLAFLDADDAWMPDKLAKQLAFMRNGNIGFSFTAYKLMDESGALLGQSVDLTAPSSVDYKAMLAKEATMGCLTVMVDREQIGKVSMPHLRRGQDYASWLKILKSGHLAHLLREELALYRITRGSISRNKIHKARAQWHIYRDLEQLPLIDSTQYFIRYAWRAVFRR